MNHNPMIGFTIQWTSTPLQYIKHNNPYDDLRNLDHGHQPQQKEKSKKHVSDQAPLLLCWFFRGWNSTQLKKREIIMANYKDSLVTNQDCMVSLSCHRSFISLPTWMPGNFRHFRFPWDSRTPGDQTSWNWPFWFAGDFSFGRSDP